MEPSEFDYPKEFAAMNRLIAESTDHRAIVTAVMAEAESTGCMMRVAAICATVGASAALLFRDRVPSASALGGVVTLLAGGAWGLSTYFENWAKKHTNQLSQSHALRVRMILQSIRERMPSFATEVDKVEASLFPQES
jgi:hypothetical protein